MTLGMTDRRKQLMASVARAVADFQTAVHMIDDAAASRLSLNATDLRCLGRVAAAGPITAGALARATELSPGGITTAVDRLQRRGYVRRANDPSDRRKVLIQATARARKILAETYGPVGRAGIRSLARYSDADLVLLREFLEAGRELQIDHARQIAGRNRC